jgi:hypothetical protein
VQVLLATALSSRPLSPLVVGSDEEDEDTDTGFPEPVLLPKDKDEDKVVVVLVGIPPPPEFVFVEFPDTFAALALAPESEPSLRRRPPVEAGLTLLF